VEMLKEIPFEVAIATLIGCIISPKLHLQGLPGNGGLLSEVAHPVGEPTVNINGHGGTLQPSQGPAVDGNWSRDDFIEKLRPQRNR